MNQTNKAIYEKQLQEAKINSSLLSIFKIIKLLMMKGMMQGREKYKKQNLKIKDLTVKII